MSASDEPRGTATIFTPSDLQPHARAILTECGLCRRVMMCQAVWVTEHGEIECLECHAVENPDEPLISI